MKIRKFETPASVIDANHPDHIDRREMQLRIDLEEGRWFHISVVPKNDSRGPEPLSRCDIFKAQTATILNELFDRTFPEKNEDILTFSTKGILTTKFRNNGDLAFPVMSFHADAKTQEFVMNISNHGWLSIADQWQRTVSEQLRRHARYVY